MPTCTLTLDRLSVQLDCALPGVIERLQACYQPFLGDVAKPDLIVHLNSIDLHARPGLPRDFEFRSGVLVFTSIGYTGQIDLRAGRADLDVTTLNLFEDVDYFVRCAIALLAFEAGGLLFHAAGLDRYGHGYAFFGYSGSGKTTVARLSPEARLLNDDLILLFPEADGWCMAATPFSNPTQHAPSGPHRVGVAGLYRLVQDRRVFVEDRPRGQAVAELVASAPVVSADPSRALALVTRAQQLAQAVPVRYLHFLPDNSFWAVISDR